MVLQLTVFWYIGAALGHVCLGLGLAIKGFEEMEVDGMADREPSLFQAGDTVNTSAAHPVRSGRYVDAELRR